MDVILLDPKIRDFVLVPIFFIVCMATLLRQNLMTYMKSEPAVDVKEVRNAQHMTRAKLLKINGDWLTPGGFFKRKAFYNKKDTGFFWNPPPQKNPLEAMAQADPSQTAGMMKQQMVFLFLNGGLAYFINYLFSGFVVAKTPFPLTYKFKSMLQRGVDVASLDSTYVSSFSWYFVALFGSSGVISLFYHIGGAGDMDTEDLAALSLGATMGRESLLSLSVHSVDLF